MVEQVAKHGIDRAESVVLVGSGKIKFNPPILIPVFKPRYMYFKVVQESLVNVQKILFIA